MTSRCLWQKALYSNKNVNIKFSAYDAFLEKPSPGTLKVKSPIALKSVVEFYIMFIYAHFSIDNKIEGW
jgi:hypothetical protein